MEAIHSRCCWQKERPTKTDDARHLSRIIVPMRQNARIIPFTTTYYARAHFLLESAGVCTHRFSVPELYQRVKVQVTYFFQDMIAPAPTRSAF